MIKFSRYEEEPVIPKTQGTFYSRYSANPDLVFFKDRYHLYFRGQGEEGHDQIGVAYCLEKDFDGVHWDMYSGNPIIKTSNKEEDFDSNHILDPGAVVFDNKVYLYYTALSLVKPVSIGLAISEDGTTFEKVEGNPVITGAYAPEIVVRNNLFYLFYQRIDEKGSFKIYCSTSSNGIHFDIKKEKLVFEATGIKNDFDEFSISTIRIWEENGWFYMTYGASDRHMDYPSAIGLARSMDLFTWERYPENPVFCRGDAGTWDEGAVWFPLIHKVGDTYYMLYEGGGTGMGLKTLEAREASKICRETSYGGYGSTSFSQIGLAYYKGQRLEW